MKPQYTQGSGIGFSLIHPHRSQLDRETWIANMSRQRGELAEVMDYVGLLELAKEYESHGMITTANGVRKQAGRVAVAVYKKAVAEQNEI